MAHLCTPKSIPAHSQNLSILFNCVWRVWRLFVIAARSSAYAAELILNLDVPNVYPLLPLCSHLSNGSRNIKNRYGLRVSPWMVPLWMGIGFFLPKCLPVNIVVECAYMFPISVTASNGYPRSFIIAKSLA